ncbi:hypothetical protein FDP41_003141 [Naegleria fowleri]|uniref:Uncharacterized protein n=1 Tax=Naegleria fowleri TaxID=5763 RepID=A0A6A5BXZ7_NAEFO|nr:uncharacterized protein FDP41_003141 [Naegleria fowleri]KAF0977819.1 hypothetical protein FDP41_003141 [Naegleria fowleri]
MCEYQRTRLRDRAFVILTYLDVKYREPETHVKVEKRMKQKVNSITQRLSKNIKERLTNSRHLFPQRESISYTTSSAFINDLLDFFKQHLRHCFDENEAKSIIENEGNRFKKEQFKQQWKNVKPYVIKKVSMILENMTRNALQLLNRLKVQLEKYSIGIDMELLKDGDAFVNEVVSLLDPSIEHNSNNKLASDIYNAIVEHEQQLQNSKEDSFNLLNANCHESLEMISRPEIQQLLQEYQYKSNQKDITSITIGSKYPTPFRNPDKGLFFPIMESENTDELKDKKYCASNDSLLKYSLSKFRKSSIVVEREVEHQRAHNEILITNTDHLKLGISYSTHFQRITEYKDTDTAQKPPSRVHVVFVITRPRGKYFQPNLLFDQKELLYSHKVPHLFIIATESCYLERYQRIIAQQDKEFLGEYYFLILNSNHKLGYGTLETCVFETAIHLKFEVITITYDDTDRGYEYFFDKKIIMDHKWALIRYFCFAEKTLYLEALGSKNKSGVKLELKKIMQEITIDTICFEDVNNKNRLVNLEEQMGL